MPIQNCDKFPSTSTCQMPFVNSGGIGQVLLEEMDNRTGSFPWTLSLSESATLDNPRLDYWQETDISTSDKSIMKARGFDESWNVDSKKNSSLSALSLTWCNMVYHRFYSLSDSVFRIIKDNNTFSFLRVHFYQTWHMVVFSV